jgi:hypothetical protein
MADDIKAKRLNTCIKCGALKSSVDTISKIIEKGIDDKLFDILCKGSVRGWEPDQIVFITYMYNKGYSDTVINEIGKFFDKKYSVEIVKTIINKCNFSPHKMSVMFRNLTGEQEYDSDEMLKEYLLKISGNFNTLEKEKEYYEKLIVEIEEILGLKKEEHEKLSEKIKELKCRGEEVDDSLLASFNESNAGYKKLEQEYKKYKQMYESCLREHESLKNKYSKLNAQKKEEDDLTDAQVEMLLSAFNVKTEELKKTNNDLKMLSKQVTEMEINLTKLLAENNLLKKDNKKPSILKRIMEQEERRKKSKDTDKDKEDISTEKKLLIAAMIKKNYDAEKMEIIRLGMTRNISTETLIELVEQEELSTDKLRITVDILSGHMPDAVQEKNEVQVTPVKKEEPVSDSDTSGSKPEAADEHVNRQKKNNYGDDEEEE